MPSNVAKASPRVWGGKGAHDRAAESEAILADKVKGMRLSQLAEKYGMSSATVVRRVAAAVEARTPVTVAAYREQQNALYDELMAGHEQNYAAGTALVQRGSLVGAEDNDMIDRGLAVRAKALEGMTRVSERRARLNGLDAPIRTEVEVVEVTAQERELRDLLAAAAAAQVEREASIVDDEGDQ